MSIIVLNATTKSIEALLSGAVSANQPEFSAHYADVTSSAFTEGENDGTLNSTTAVTLVAAPAASTRRIVKEIVIYNADTSPVTVTIRINNNGSYRRIQKVTLAAGESWKLSGTASSSSATYDFASDIHGATEKTTLADADEVGIVDSAAANVKKRITWANIKVAIISRILASVSDGQYLLRSGSDIIGGTPAGGGGGEPIEGYLINGKISVTVTSNNITVAVKTLAGADPSGGDPVQIRIGNVIREITSALSVTKNAGTNWCNAGGSELATKEIDYFVYVGYNATDDITLGFSRIPFGNVYSDFSATTTSEKYCAISTITNAAAGDNYVNVGRFAATLSAGAGYTWSVPTFTSSNLIQRPIFETRWLVYSPVYSASGSMTFTSVTVYLATYKIAFDLIYFDMRLSGTTGGTAATDIIVSLPIDFLSVTAWIYVGGGALYDGADKIGYMIRDNSNAGVRFLNATHANWGLGAARECRGKSFYQI